jgi:hypothetical protein
MNAYFDGLVNYSDHCREPVFQGFFNRQPEFLAQWQRIVAQRHKIVYENGESWYF